MSMAYLDKRIVLAYPDGSLEIIRPVALPREGQSEAEYLEERYQRAVAVNPALRDATLIGTVNASELPLRRFRDAWRHAGGRIVPNVNLARARVLAEVRAERNARLDDTERDKSKLDDVGTNQQKQAMKEYRQALRDLPAAVETDLAALATIEAIAAYTPAWPEKPEVGSRPIQPGR